LFTAINDVVKGEHSAKHTSKFSWIFSIEAKKSKSWVWFTDLMSVKLSIVCMCKGWRISKM